jgi:Predicted dioxygenase
MKRKSAVAGYFYEKDSEELKKQIESCFKSKLGPGMPKEISQSKVENILRSLYLMLATFIAALLQHMPIKC